MFGFDEKSWFENKKSWWMMGSTARSGGETACSILKPTPGMADLVEKATGSYIS